ncbi:hypothetical protein F5878DRAFT_606792 [Lentinula raphanica]|uniref:Secreted protein n=1 Tax=Lentinula raphanica TaxID=153919 RepID=A0AA38UL97_9AGAR|nr:hypothetical protein F5880DRAFT_1578564 [Lentinula raphanica]KAJ3842777.1 hypothetical protein F5878DRAFT_606792 [Lentinula raphanica]
MRLFTFVFSLIAIVLLTASAADAIAIDPKAACGSEGDNNKDYTEGHECKYLVTDLEPHPHLVTYAGTCQTDDDDGILKCLDASQLVERRMIRRRRPAGIAID